MTLDTARFMLDPSRAQRRGDTGERDLLVNFLEFQRDTLLWKLNSLTREQLTATHTPSGMSLLGLLKHLAYVERSWFQIRLLGRPLTVPWRAGDPGGDFRIEPNETPDAVLAFYVREVEESRRILADAPSLDARAAKGGAAAHAPLDSRPHDRGDGPPLRPRRLHARVYGRSDRRVAATQADAPGGPCVRADTPPAPLLRAGPVRRR